MFRTTLAVLLATMTYSAMAENEMTDSAVENRVCREGSTATGWICSGRLGRGGFTQTAVLFVCRRGQWVYDPNLNGGFVPPPECYR